MVSYSYLFHFVHLFAAKLKPKEANYKLFEPYRLKHGVFDDEVFLLMDET